MSQQSDYPTPKYYYISLRGSNGRWDTMITSPFMTDGVGNNQVGSRNFPLMSWNEYMGTPNWRFGCLRA